MSDEASDRPADDSEPDDGQEGGEGEVVEIVEVVEVEGVDDEGNEVVVEVVEVEVEEILLAPGPKDAYVKLWQPQLPIPDPGSGGPVIFIGKAPIGSWQDTPSNDQADWVAGYRSNDQSALNAYVGAIPAVRKQWLLNLNAVPTTSTIGQGFQVIYAFVPTAPPTFVADLQGLLNSPLPLQFVSMIQDTRGDPGPTTLSYQAFAALVVTSVTDLGTLKPAFDSASHAPGKTQYALGGSYNSPDTLKRR